MSKLTDIVACIAAAVFGAFVAAAFASLLFKEEKKEDSDNK